jgi:hypothetical protein
MTLRHRIGVSFAVVLLGAPALASQPERYALEMIANPLVLDTTGGTPIQTGGFKMYQVILAQPISDIVTFEMALVPFGSGPTVIRLYGQVPGSQPVSLTFEDGLVAGLPYDRNRWNDVRVDLHVATQQFDLTVNGVHGGPFPFCRVFGGCNALVAFELDGVFFEEDIAWADSIRVVRETPEGPQILLDLPFDTVNVPNYGGYFASYGGLLVVEPPRRLAPRSVATTIGAQPRPDWSPLP